MRFLHFQFDNRANFGSIISFIWSRFRNLTMWKFNLDNQIFQWHKVQSVENLPDVIRRFIWTLSEQEFLAECMQQRSLRLEYLYF